LRLCTEVNSKNLLQAAARSLILLQKLLQGRQPFSGISSTPHLLDVWREENLFEHFYVHFPSNLSGMWMKKTSILWSLKPL